MGLFRRTPQACARRRRKRRSRWRKERRAAERTARAEAMLTQTEQQIHDLADEVRRDLRGQG